MKHLLTTLTVASILLYSCNRDDMPVAPEPTTVKEWNLTLSAKNEIPAAGTGDAAGTAKLALLSDNSLRYDFSVTGLATGDVLTMSHLHAGNAGSNGPVILPLAMSFTAPNASGIISGLRQSLVDSLKSDVNEIYFNAHSQQSPAGIVRAQLNTNIEFAMDVTLSSENEVHDPASPITPVATGTAILRVTSAKQLYSKVTVTGLGDTDTLTMAHIHTGAAGVNGPVYIMICATKDDFDVLKETDLTDEQIGKIKTDALYVNAHSVKYPAGVARGQIR